MNYISEGLMIRKVHPDAIMPTRAHPTDAGLDLYSHISLAGCDTLIVDIGIAISIPRGWVGLMTARSSQGMDNISTHLGVIDSGYHGSLKVLLRKHSFPGIDTCRTIAVSRGERIAQLILLPIATPELIEVDTFSDSSRGEKGFGSSGK